MYCGKFAAGGLTRGKDPTGCGGYRMIILQIIGEKFGGMENSLYLCGDINNVFCLCGIMEERLSNIYLRNGENALTYVQSLNAGVRHIATEAILVCLKLGYPLNNMEITSKAREMQRMRMRARDESV